jgi:hypothetical protein
MKRWLLVLGLLAALLPVQGAPAGRSARWPTFEGAWFSVRYPPGFRVRPSLRSLTAPTGEKGKPQYDSAFFLSPDRGVEFYVFSPQWNGSPSDILANPRKETVVSSKTEKRAGKGEGMGLTVRWVTLRARDGSYTRSYVDTESENNTRLVFGLKYRDARARQRYQSDYQAFKDSLQQFAD